MSLRWRLAVVEMKYCVEALGLLLKENTTCLFSFHVSTISSRGHTSELNMKTPTYDRERVLVLVLVREHTFYI